MDFQVALASFGLLFIMEIGDKTQLAVLTLTARTGQTVAVCVGAVLALACVTILGVGVGAIAVDFMPVEWLPRVAAIAFIAVGGFMLWSSRPGATRSEENKRENGGKAFAMASGPFKVMAGSFGLLFVAEMGDKTQLAVISLTARTSSPLSVFLGATLALAVVTILGALAGKVVTRIVPTSWISRGVGVLFILIGLLSLLGVF